MRRNNQVIILNWCRFALGLEWFGFKAGSSVSSGRTTVQAQTATQAAAVAGALMWMVVELAHQGKATALGFASGSLAGLVAVTLPPEWYSHPELSFWEWWLPWFATLPFF